ncbi:unnamed protein product [Brachionus calyciflorus]|uniref:BTB domain-containing protein n=1 Tax=Brachionus calyciflorus TaxID=104777 RepID=A0A813M7L9_9BILA|nr:unnamed protein product [Brachionus calyciflorus]
MSIKTELVECDESYIVKRKYSPSPDLISKRLKITASPSSSSVSSAYSIESDYEPPLNENYVLNFFNNLKHNLQLMPYDLVFTLANGKQVNAHKILVLNSSVFFSNILSKNCLQTSEKIFINLPTIYDVDSFRFCINFIQTGRVGTPPQNDKLFDLRNMAIILQLNDLIDQLNGLIEKYELEASYSNFRAILTNFYTTINQSILSQNQKLDDLKNIANNTNNFVFNTINRDFMIRDKYIYNSQILSDQSYESFFENFKMINIKSNLNENSASESFNRNSFVIFSVDSINLNYVLKTQLSFTDTATLHTGIENLFENLMRELTEKKFRLQLNRICYLKKPSNCKSIKLETIKTSTDCFRAIVEYSRTNLNKELPFVLVTCHLSVNF